MQVGYDSLQIESAETFRLKEKSIELVEVGYLIDDVFCLVDEQKPTYSQKNGDYLLHFRFNLKLARETVFYNLRIRYLKEDYDFLDFDTMLTVIKYPYADAEFSFFYKDILWGMQWLVQDFDLDDDLIFLHTYGPGGLYQYNMNSKSRSALIEYYPSGDYISSDSNRIFVDMEHTSVKYYDLLKGELSAEPIISFSDTPHYDILGLEAANGILYIIWGRPDLYLFDYRGNKLDVIDYGVYSYSLGYKDGVLYSLDAQNQILRFDVKQKKFLEPRPAPTSGIDAVQIEGDYLYFSDYYKKFIGRVPLKTVIDFNKTLPVHRNK